MRGRFHDPADCPTCVELPHLAAFGLPMWAICEQLGMTVSAVARHVRSYPDLAARIPSRALDDLRRADSAARHQRSTRPKENAA